MEELTIRKANAEDLDRIAEIIAGEPGQEAMAICGCEEAARKFGMGYARMPGGPQGWECSVLAEVDGEAVGLLQTGTGGETFLQSLRALPLVFRTFGVGVVSVYGRQRARSRVQPPTPAGSYHIKELDVDPAYRNRGIGGRLLDYAEADARKGTFGLMSLHTTTNNPARHLYERHGFAVVTTRTDSSYERYTGIAGRHLMVKDIS